MHKKLFLQERKGLAEGETINRAALQPDQSAYPGGGRLAADTEIDQDTAEPGILFCPRLHFVPK